MTALLDGIRVLDFGRYIAGPYCAALLAEGAAKIPCGPVLNAQAALDHPQVKAMNLFEELAYPGLPRPAPVARVPLSFSATENGIRHRAPLLGEHTDEILGELGYTSDNIAGLRERGIV